MTSADRLLLLQLQRRALLYFVENQTDNGLVLDRQRNFGPRATQGLCSTAATGMGFIALALASAAPHRLLDRTTAVRRVRVGLETALERLPHAEGVVPHFIDSRSGAVVGTDHFSTVETAWLAAGGLWAATFLNDSGLIDLADRFYHRIHWHWWTAPEESQGRGLLRHGQSADGRFLGCSWDRANGETAFMYVLAAGARAERAIPTSAWRELRPFYGTVAGLRFNNADLGLFVFQYGLDLLDLVRWQAPCGLDLHTEAGLAAVANRQACRLWAERFVTFHYYWGLSAGDGPDETGWSDVYRAYAPAGPVDGTAHLTATLASVGHAPGSVLENVHVARCDTRYTLLGRYGFSNVNLDRDWTSRDMVGIDAGAAVLGLDNFLFANRVRSVFHSIPYVHNGLMRLGFRSRPAQEARSAA
ncbi:MAG: hypothetical protein NZ700_10075 [Gemmataceae bacterium]|nr:hypothetical protein [Gemmataceae bacterium]MDW8264028.1 glucoamylase family protein [Gemmataceae bacterium]